MNGQNDNPDERELRDPIMERFGDSSVASPLTGEELEFARRGQESIRSAVVNLARLIDAYVPEGRNKSLAYTALEDVQMRSNRALFLQP